MYKFDEKKHIHILNEKPLVGTTTLIKEVMPPPLTWWASGKALEGLGWTNPKLTSRPEGIRIASKQLSNLLNFEDEDYYDFLQECYKAHDSFKKEAGDWGKETHAHIEEVVKTAIKTNNGFLLDTPYLDEAVKRFASWGRGKQFIYCEVHVYSEFLWLGGIIDLVYKENDEYYIGDVKTSKSIYPTQFIQEGLYDLQQGENGFLTPDGSKLGEALPISGYTVINISRVNGGVKEKTYRNTEAMKALGLNLVSTYKTIKELDLICQ